MSAAGQLLRRRALPPRVLVVGGGPVGLSMAFLLDRVFNVPTRVIERQLQPTTHPQAHFLNLRTMEVLQTMMPGFHDRLQAHAAPSELWRDYIYCTGVGKAREFARIDQFGSCIPRTLPPTVALAAISPTQFLHFPQNRFEAMLSEFLQEHALPVDRGVELLDLSVDAAGRANVSLRHTASQELEHASFDYVIGADGAHSLVRQLCDIEMAGALNLQSIVNVHFTSSALSKTARENPAMLYFIFNKDVIGVLIAHDLSRGEWVFQIPFFPPQESVDVDFSPAQCRAIVQQILPTDALLAADDTRILSVGQWRMSARVAKQYDAHRRVFLVGDAAHQFPPAGGLGMNTGIQDAHNLAWKLALALQQQDANANGSSSSDNSNETLDAAALLRSYEHERQLVAKLNTQLSLRNVERTMKIPNALNVSHNNAKLLAAVVNAAPLKFLPLAAQRDVVQSVMKVGKAPLALLDAAGSAVGSFMRRRAQQIVDARASLGMLFYHFDIGFSYDARDWSTRARALMQDAALDESARFDASANAATAKGVYAPQFRVGERFPHFWVVPPSEAQDAQHVSTLALSAHAMALQTQSVGDVLYTLVVNGEQLRDADLQCLLLHGGDTSSNALLRRHVALVVLDDSDAAGSSDGQMLSRSFAAVHRWRVASDSASRAKWHEFAAYHSAALVRPDGHVGCLWTPQQLHASSGMSVADALHQSFTLS